MNNVSLDREININDYEKAICKVGLAAFCYYPAEGTIINTDILCDIYKCKKTYRNDASGFVDEVVCVDDRVKVTQLYEHIVNGEDHCSDEFRLKQDMMWCRVTLSVVEKDDMGMPTKVIGIVEDISKYKKYEKYFFEELNKVNNEPNIKIENVLSDIEIGLECSYDDEYFTIDYCSEARAAIQGYTSQELYDVCDGKFSNSIYNEDVMMVSRKISKASAENKPYYVEYRVRHKDGRIIWVANNGKRIVREDGSVRHYCLVKNITEAKAKEDMLKRDMKNFDILVDLSGDIIYSYDVSTRRISITSKAYDKKIFVGCYDNIPYGPVEKGLITNDTKNEFIRIYEDIINGKLEAKGVVGRVLTNGAIGIFELHLKAIVDENGVSTGKAIGMYKDITRQYLEAQRKEVDIKRILEDEDKINDLENERKTRRLSAFYSMGENYLMFYHIDLNRNRSLLLREKDLEAAKYAGISNYDAAIRYYADNYVCETSREDYLLYTDREYLKTNLANNNNISFEYESTGHGWCRAEYIIERRNNEGEPCTAFLVVNIIDDEKIKQIQQATALKSAYELAKSASESKTRFLSNMSHDIRTPLNAINGFSTIALNNLNTDKDIEKIKTYLYKILSASEHLQGLINEVLDMSRIESGKIIVEETNITIGNIIEQIKNICISQASSKNQRIVFNLNDTAEDIVCVDDVKLRRVLTNIIINAINYTGDNGEIKLDIRKEYVSDKITKYIFIIKDNGIGMDEELLDRVFEPFERGGNSTQSGVVGTGLGLCIAKNLVELMDGIIKVKSKKNEGTEFIIQLNMKNIDKTEIDNIGTKEQTNNMVQDNESEEKKNKRFVGKRVLLVEDNEINMEIGEIYLRGSGFEVETAINGQESVNKLEESETNYYDVVLMDVQMPIMGGYEATRQIRKSDRQDLQEIPIIAMTANAFEEDKQNAFEAGMSGHISKPISQEKLLDMLGKFI